MTIIFTEPRSEKHTHNEKIFVDTAVRLISPQRHKEHKVEWFFAIAFLFAANPLPKISPQRHREHKGDILCVLCVSVVQSLSYLSDK